MLPNIERICSALDEVAPSYDISRVYLFGSYARGNQNENSDVDLCLETGPSFSLFDAGCFADELNGKLGVPVDVVTVRTCYPHVRENMLKERILVYLADIRRRLSPLFPVVFHHDLCYNKCCETQ